MNRIEKFSKHIADLSLFDSTIYNLSLRFRNEIRTFFADRYLQGQGIEIGAQHLPTALSRKDVSIQYVDRMPKEVNANLHGLQPSSLVTPSFYLEADELHIFKNSSLDFVIGNHILEHIDDPLFTIQEWLRVLKPNGILFLSVPNYRSNEYDFIRKPLDRDHFIQAFSNRNPDYRYTHKTQHWKEFIQEVEEISENDPAFEPIFKRYSQIDDRIHFHVYDENLVLSLFKYLAENRGLHFTIEDQFSFVSSFEILFIVRKGNPCKSFYPGQFQITLGKLRNLALLTKIAIATRIPRIWHCLKMAFAKK